MTLVLSHAAKLDSILLSFVCAGRPSRGEKIIEKQEFGAKSEPFAEFKIFIILD